MQRNLCLSRKRDKSQRWDKDIKLRFSELIKEQKVDIIVIKDIVQM